MLTQRDMKHQQDSEVAGLRLSQLYIVYSILTPTRHIIKMSAGVRRLLCERWLSADNRYLVAQA